MATRPMTGARKPRRKSPEADLQITAVAYLRLVLPEPCRVWFVPQGGNLSKAQAAKFQKMGLLAGVHDVHVMVPDGFYTLEFKAGRGTLTDGQADFAAAVDRCGHGWREIRSLEDVGRFAAELVARHGLKLRPVVMTPGGVLWDRGTR